MTEPVAKEEKMFKPAPVKAPSHVANLTPEEPQPIRDHNELIADMEAQARAYLDEVAQEYGQYRAAEDIPTSDGVLIYPKGAAVPVSNVKLHGYDKSGQVEKVEKVEK